MGASKVVVLQAASRPHLGRLARKDTPHNGVFLFLSTFLALGEWCIMGRNTTYSYDLFRQCIKNIF